MRGVIRTREKCGHCGEGYEEKRIGREDDLFCSCERTPRTYYIYLYWKGDHKLTQDKEHKQLDSYRRASRLRERINSEIDDGTFDISDYKVKTRKHFSPRKLIVKWYKSKCKKGLAPTTRKGHREYIRNYFSPFVQKIKLDHCGDIRTHHIDAFFESLPSPRLEPKTKKNIMGALGDFVSWLIRKEILERNPEFPEIDVPHPIPRWTKQSIVLAALPFVPEHDRPVINFMLFHPLRSGEVCMLRVKDFNLEEGYIHVHRALSLGEERTRKNKKEYLCALSEKFDKSVLRLKFPEAYAFINSIGNHYNSNHLKKIWKKACEDANIEYIPLKYAGRTTIATAAINRGESMSAVAAALGDSEAVTRKHYAHLSVHSTRGVIDGK